MTVDVDTVTVYEVFGVAPGDGDYLLAERPSPGGPTRDVLKWKKSAVNRLHVWPDAEVTGTIGRVDVNVVINAYGDDPGSVFLSVAGFDLEKAEAAWRRVAANLPLRAWWGT